MATPSPLAGGLLTLRIGVWLFSYALFAAILSASGALGPRTAPFIFVLAGIGIILSGAVETAVNRSRHWPTGKRFAFVSTAIVMVTTINAAIDVSTLGRVFAPPAGMTPRYVLMSGLQSFAFLVWIHAFYGACVWLIRASINLVEKEKRLVEAKAEAQRATLRALRSQINPHFLFNALNAAASLVATGRNREAEELIVRLSEFFRSSLSGDRDATISLSDELETLDAYLQIELIRFPDRLDISMDCPPQLAHAHIPSFLLQPLVENAIKHAVAPSSSPVHVRVSARADRGRLNLCVEDEGSADKAGASTGAGVGLRNISERLKATYGDEASVHATHTQRGFKVELDLPLLVAP